MTLAKALAGGVAMGGLIARPEAAEKLKPGTHAATFGGNPLACRAALATIETIEADDLLARADQIGDRFRNAFEALRGALSSDPGDSHQGSDDRRRVDSDGAPIVQGCLERRLLINCTHGTVLRLLPALTLTDEQLDEGCAYCEEVVRQQS